MRLPSQRQIRQLESVVANHPSGFFDLAAAPRQPLAVAAWPTSPRKTRVRGFRRHASGQTSSRRRCRSIITPGLRGCGYKTVSGRHEWPNRDPLGEPGFEVMQRAAPYRAHSLVQGPAERIEGPNLYEYVRNNPIQYVDPLGLQVPPQVIQEIDEILSSPEAQAEEQAAETELATLMQQARDLYPKLCNKFQWHHITPKYLGGDPNGPLVLLEGPYHQLITNAFRNQWAYGQGVPPSTTVVNIVNTVYSQLPLPK